MGEITNTPKAPRCLRLAMPSNKSIQTCMNLTDGELFHLTRSIDVKSYIFMCHILQHVLVLKRLLNVGTKHRCEAH